MDANETGIGDLLPLALDITTTLSSADRSRRLVEVVSSALPCDSVALMKAEGDALVVTAALGLSEDIYGRRFLPSEHPRLDIISSSTEPVRFPAESPLPDPFDGLVVDGPAALSGHVHSCLGCSLRVGDELVGVLAADALKPGAFESLSDGFLSHLAALAGAALRTNQLIEALESKAERLGVVARDLVQEEMQRSGSLLIGDSPALARLRSDMNIIAPSGFPVLVTGETGVGKELVVRGIHAASPRKDQPLIYVNCAALPEAVAESELFGHVRGAFTGADSERLGKFQSADGATLFLDEIGELPLPLQPKLLRAIQQGEVQRVGADDLRTVDVRIIAATNRVLTTEVAEGRFREDLLHRLDVCRIDIPPLRDRREDIPHLVGHFCELNRARLGTGPIRFSPDAHEVLAAAHWPGNVRELENVAARAVLQARVRSTGSEQVLVTAEDLDVRGAEARPLPAVADQAPEAQAASDKPYRERVREYERRLILSTLAASDGNWAAAARALQIDRGNLHHLARRLGIK
ncbi:MAG: nitric oxide reductase transcriptional regulator NorR [Planctomycetota bacterium]